MIVAIVGIGLIGGSLAMALKESGFTQQVIGVENNLAHAQKALDLGLVDTIMPLAEATKKANILIVATPVDTLVTLLPKVLDIINDHQIVIEVGSTKTNIVAAISNHVHRRRFVATHPMAGTEFSGPEAAIPKLFDGKYNVMVDIENSDADAVKTIEKMYESIGMINTYLEATSHDIHTAYISHISHICSFALALTVLDKEKEEDRIFELASTGFASTVRLAKSSPETWIPIFRQNRENVLDVLDEYITTLLKFKGLMLSDSYETLHKQLAQANDIRRILEHKEPQ